MTSGPRDILSGTRYIKHFPGSNLTREQKTVMDMGDVFDTVDEMAKIVRKTLDQTKPMAAELKGNGLEATCRKVWDFCFNYFQYKIDNKGVEELRTPARSWADRKQGIDCDDYSILAASILTNLNIPCHFRMAKYNGKDYYQHIYVVVPKAPGVDLSNKANYYVIDPVVDRFDYEAPYTAKSDKKFMKTANLSGLGGLPIQVLSGVGNMQQLGGISAEHAAKVSTLSFGNEMDGFGEFKGLGNVSPTPRMLATDFLFRLKRHLINTVKKLKANPEIMPGEKGKNFKTRLEYLLANFDNPETRKKALDHLVALEKGLSGLGTWGIFKAIDDGLEAIGDGLSNATDWAGETVKKGWEGVKNAADWAGETVTKGWKGVKNAADWAWDGIKKYSPLTVGIRAAFRGVLAINFLKISERLGWGYLTDAQAREKGLDMAAFAKLKRGLQKVINTYEDFGGKPSRLKDAILKGWRRGTDNGRQTGGLSGFQGLGVVVATTAAVTAAPITTIVLSILSGISAVFKVLFSLFKGKKGPTDYPSTPPDEDDIRDQLANLDQQKQGGMGDDKKKLLMAAGAGLLLMVVATREPDKKTKAKTTKTAKQHAAV